METLDSCRRSRIRIGTSAGMTKKGFWDFIRNRQDVIETVTRGRGLHSSLGTLVLSRMKTSSIRKSWIYGWTLTGSFFRLTSLHCPDLVSLLLVGWQPPPCKLTIASEYSSGMKPLAAFRAAINSISIRNNILLITPVVHILSH
jgi:hypothetical protein